MSCVIEEERDVSCVREGKGCEGCEGRGWGGV